MTIGILGAGAFGTALAVTLAQDGHDIRLWARDPATVDAIRATRRAPRLPQVELPLGIEPTNDVAWAMEPDVLLFAVPAQALFPFLSENGHRVGDRAIVACCKGIDIASMTGPSATLARHCPDATVAVLTGPSFANDIAKGLPTALTLACTDDSAGVDLQQRLSTRSLRLYRSGDLIGADLGGALKNVMAIACGACIGAGYGDSARAALLTRGFAEMTRFATLHGAKAETLMGLSGLGDLMLTCSSELSRNFRFGLRLGEGGSFDEDVTVEGAKTAIAVQKIAEAKGLDLPISSVVARLVKNEISVEQALKGLLSRPLKEE